MKTDITMVGTVRVELGQWELTINEKELERLATMANHSFRDADIDEAIAWIVRAWSYMGDDGMDEPGFSGEAVMNILTSLVGVRDDHRFIMGLGIARKEGTDVR